MKSIICPTSTERVDENAMRITGFLIVIGLFCAFFMQSNLIIAAVAMDYAIRAFTNWPYSPFSKIANQLVRRLKWRSKYIDKAPKIFAARVGFVFAGVGFILMFFNPIAGSIVLGVLCMFACLESLGNLCMGCLVYTHVVVKIYGEY